MLAKTLFPWAPLAGFKTQGNKFFFKIILFASFGVLASQLLGIGILWFRKTLLVKNLLLAIKQAGWELTGKEVFLINKDFSLEVSFKR